MKTKQIVKDSIIVDNFPTKELMQKAREENLMVLSFVVQPECVKTTATAEAFQTGWLMGLGLEPDPRLALVVIPRNLDFESAKQAYLDKLQEQ